jgi:putative addiction module component (TIGR02574 family)
MTTALLKKATSLPVPDRIKLVEDIWDSISNEADDSLTPAQKRELDRRLDAMRKSPGRAVPWDEAKQQILKRRSRAK